MLSASRPITSYSNSVILQMIRKPNSIIVKYDIISSLLCGITAAAELHNSVDLLFGITAA